MKSNQKSALTIGMASDPGSKRGTEPNQDSILVIPTEKDRPPLFMVADGMGGHAGGADASKLVVAAVASHYRSLHKVDNLSRILQDCLQFALQTLTDHVVEHPELASMGSTAVVAVPKDGKVVVANVGDSRAYRFRYKNLQGKPQKTSGFRLFQRKTNDTDATRIQPEVDIFQLSYDHSVVADLVRAGQLTPEQAMQSSQRNRLTQSITPRRVDLVPHIDQFPFESGDTLLLCSDGLWGVVPEATMVAIAMELPPAQAVEKLVQQANNYGGPDNISVIIVKME
jgi:serine/threonine protein phosphatase PrpC